jgi:hypothetical protein
MQLIDIIDFVNKNNIMYFCMQIILKNDKIVQELKRIFLNVLSYLSSIFINKILYDKIFVR